MRPRRLSPLPPEGGTDGKLGSEADGAGGVAGVGGFVEEELGGGAAEQMAGAGGGGAVARRSRGRGRRTEGRGDGDSGGELDVVVADDDHMRRDMQGEHVRDGAD